jgi:hypothetical protein
MPSGEPKEIESPTLRLKIKSVATRTDPEGLREIERTFIFGQFLLTWRSLFTRELFEMVDIDGSSFILEGISTGKRVPKPNKRITATPGLA